MARSRGLGGRSTYSARPSTIPRPIDVAAVRPYARFLENGMTVRMHQNVAMRIALVLLTISSPVVRGQSVSTPAHVLAARRASAMHAAPDAIILIRSRSAEMTGNADGMRQAATFYYFAGLPNAIGAVLALDARRNESWLFVPDPGSLSGGFGGVFHAPYGYVAAGSQTAAATSIEHVGSWSELDVFLARRLSEDSTLVLRGPFRADPDGGRFSPPVAAGQNESAMWQYALHTRFPRAAFGDMRRVSAARTVKDSAEIAIMRRVAETSAAALRAGLASLKPGRRQRSAEVDVLAACVAGGAEGISFWPWVMTGPNSSIVQALQSLADVRFLDRTMGAGELARVDVGCAREGYEGDVGRTAPVSGRFDVGQREGWELLVAAYRAGLAAMRPGRSARDVLDAFRAAVEKQRPSLRTAFGKRTAEVALARGGLDGVELHGVGIESAEFLIDTLRAGNVLAFEPILTVDGVGLYLEDMILITNTGAEVLTKGLPYSAAEIERAVQGRRRDSADDQLREATQEYAARVAAMDNAAIAALFTTDGEMVVVGQPSVRGRDAIRRHLETFKEFHVEMELLTADTVAARGNSGRVEGTYRQRVRVPAGDVVEVHGTYVAEWMRERNSTWHIRRVLTTPQQ